jgi:hypothetical protein
MDESRCTIVSVAGGDRRAGILAVDGLGGQVLQEWLVAGAAALSSMSTCLWEHGVTSTNRAFTIRKTIHVRTIHCK